MSHGRMALVPERGQEFGREVRRVEAGEGEAFVGFSPSLWSRALARTTAAALGAILALVGTVSAPAQERPFEPVFEVSSALRSADEPTQVQLYFELPEGHAFPSRAVLEIPAEYQIPRGSDVSNNDIVGDGQITVKIGSLGIQTVRICLSNQAPARAGDWATLNVAVQLGDTQGGGCTGILNLTLGLKRQSEDGPYQAILELPSGAADAGGGAGGFGLDTPLKLTVNLYGVSRANPQSIPPGPGGAEILKNPSTPGIYEWKLTLEDPAGRVKNLSQPQRIDAPPPKPSETGKRVTRVATIVGIVVAVLVLLGLLVALARRKARQVYQEVLAEQAELESYDYYAESEFDEVGVGAGDQSQPPDRRT